MFKQAMFKQVIGTAALGCVLALSAGAALAAEKEGKKCIQINRISSIDVVDSKHIRFKTTGGPDYMNTLPHKCPGLSKHDTIMYETALSQLCDLDTITVLDQLGGGFMRGPTCGLGKFVPIDESEE